MPPSLTVKLAACVGWAAICVIHAQRNDHWRPHRHPIWVPCRGNRVWSAQRQMYEARLAAVAKEYERLKELQCQLEEQIEQIHAHQEALAFRNCHCERYDEADPDADPPVSNNTETPVAETDHTAASSVISSPESASMVPIAPIDGTASSQGSRESNAEAKSSGPHMSMQTIAILVVLCIVPVAIVIGVIILYKQR